jgi:hypothetical protein
MKEYERNMKEYERSMGVAGCAHPLCKIRDCDFFFCHILSLSEIRVSDT